MNDKSINNLITIQEDINSLGISKDIKPQIICISKTFDIDRLKPLIDYGQIHFGENKVQETESKWRSIKKENKNIKLHMVGKLQTNKAKRAVDLFEYIHSLDNLKSANLLKKREIEIKKKLSYFIQVNIAGEKQKGGILPQDVENFLNNCLKEIKLNVIGLMILPPNDELTEKYFRDLSELNSKLGLKHLSMGMSNDYKLAIKFKSTFLRIGSAIMGPRTSIK